MQSYNNNKSLYEVDRGYKVFSPTFYLTSKDPAYQYQTQKIIQKQVRTWSSLYSDNLGALHIFQYPTSPLRVNWNQMSDRNIPHYQKGSGYSQGSFYHGSSTRHTQPKLRPGAMTPGGYGVDIKHNSYYRYLGKLKAKKPIRRGKIPENYGEPIKFNCVYPIQGAKTIKTSIINGCNNCEINIDNERKIYQIYGIENKLNTTIVTHEKIPDFINKKCLEYCKQQNKIDDIDLIDFEIN
jgi:hypothetical protein